VRDENYYAMRSLMANTLRVMRGGGSPRKIIGDIECIARHTEQTSGDSNARTVAADSLASGVSSWKDWSSEKLGDACRSGGRHYARLSFEYDACRAALRIMAAEMDGNGMEASKATSDLWSAVSEYTKFLREEEAAHEAEYIKEISGIRDKEATKERRVAKNNRSVIAGANDNSTCFVYFVSDGDAIKIGKANNPRSRLGGLQTSHYKPLRILGLMPGDETLERHLHGKFRKHHIRGEWFRDCHDIRKFIRDIPGNDNAPTIANAA